MSYKILTEASNSLTSTYLLHAIKDSGNITCGSDINDNNGISSITDDFIVMPKLNDECLWNKIYSLLRKHKIEIVIPSFDEHLIGWSTIKYKLLKHGIHVLISPLETIKTFIDKWETYKFFSDIGIPTPKTMIYNNYGVLKPRFGRGTKNISFIDNKQFYLWGGGGITQARLPHYG